MWYVINCEDYPDTSALRSLARIEHLARLEQLKGQGRLLLAGPYPKIDNTNPGRHGFKGSLIIADFNSLREAETWASEDPYFKIGVYKKIEVNPFKYVLP
ncbi:MAG: hypothetical protein CBC09_01875 [Cellvibrionales bacterium TMED49]|nr:hypothetical protein [Porticoccaceae bacterium]OUU39607.1 MAG: hypothetical protein CBC09_01875 [Cellvibrionales bacterium TMED49]|tara:strand:- start:2107 stop:2406 length:300 start_codon:yes stop_codon:yes gene_type:complete